MSKKQFGWLLGFVTLLIVFWFGYRHFQIQTLNTSPIDNEEFLRQVGEQAYKRKVLAGPIAAQETIVKTLPDNSDAKRKLAELYLEVGEPEKAKPLLESLIQAGDAKAKQLYDRNF